MKQYHDAAQRILRDGELKKDRTGVGTLQVFGHSYECPLRVDEHGIIHDFPLVTTKKVFMRGTFEELMWKLSGNTNIRALVEKNVHIWTEWPFKNWLQKIGQWETFPMYVDEQKSDYSDEWKSKIQDFEQKIIGDDAFALEFGSLGKTYGYHFRHFGKVEHEGVVIQGGIDQLSIAIDKIINKPEDRRNIISLWNPHDNLHTLLPPCPCFYQFNVSDDGEHLDLMVYQRSCDVFLGVPFNTSQEALFLSLVAHVTGKKPRKLTHNFGDFHIYVNHLEQIKEQLARDIPPLPQLQIHKKTDDILGFKWEDVSILNYNPHPAIKAPVAV